MELKCAKQIGNKGRGVIIEKFSQIEVDNYIIENEHLFNFIN